MILEEFSQETFKRVCYEDGYIDGHVNTQKEMALKMKNAGEPIEKVIAYTGLSEEEIQKL